jgi:hypothetical protein
MEAYPAARLVYPSIISALARTLDSYASPSSSPLDFLVVVPDVERHLGKKIKKIWVTRVANLISEIVIGTPNVI